MKRFNGISALNKRNIEFGRLGSTFWLPFGVAARSERRSFFPVRAGSGSKLKKKREILKLL